jgi:hypothetical protein
LQKELSTKEQLWTCWFQTKQNKRIFFFYPLSEIHFFLSKGTNAVDTEASVAFFEDEDFMHGDILAEPTHHYLQYLFGDDKGVRIEMSICLPFMFPGDFVGNKKRAEFAIHEAVQHHTQFAFFPELLIGPIDEKFEFLTFLARKHRVHLSAVVLDEENHRKCVVISDNGDVLQSRDATSPVHIVETRFGHYSLFTLADLTMETLQKLKQERVSEVNFFFLFFFFIFLFALLID